MSLVWLPPGKQWKSLPETLTLNNFKSQSKEGMENSKTQRKGRRRRYLKMDFTSNILIQVAKNPQILKQERRYGRKRPQKSPKKS